MNSTERLKLIFGFIILIGLLALSVAFGLGHVEEKTSFGLLPIIGILGTLAGSWAQWAFNNRPDKTPNDNLSEPKIGVDTPEKLR